MVMNDLVRFPGEGGGGGGVDQCFFKMKNFGTLVFAVMFSAVLEYCYNSD